jgi:hypothetical protein
MRLQLPDGFVSGTAEIVQCFTNRDHKKTGPERPVFKESATLF